MATHKKVITLIAVLLIALTNGYSAGKQEIVTGNERRTFILHLPKQYSPTADAFPVLFLLHGNPSKAWHMLVYTGMNRTADKNSFIVVYPDAIDTRWAYDHGEYEEEITFFTNLIERLSYKYNIDTTRIYLAGLSGGGIFSFNVARALPNRFAAMAVIAGNLPRHHTPPLKSEPIPLLLMHGTSDYLYNGREDIYSVEQTIDFLIEHNDCNTTPSVTYLEDVNERDNSNVVRLYYPSRNGNDVVFYKIINGGHHWPNSTFDANSFTKSELGNWNRDLDTNQEIWNFVSSYSLETRSN